MPGTLSTPQPPESGVLAGAFGKPMATRRSRIRGVVLKEGPTGGGSNCRWGTSNSREEGVVHDEQPDGKDSPHRKHGEQPGDETPHRGCGDGRVSHGGQPPLPGPRRPMGGR